jgi:hypothetical protein
VLGPLNRLVWWEVPLGYKALRSFLFLQEQIKDTIIFGTSVPYLQIISPDLSVTVLHLARAKGDTKGVCRVLAHIQVQAKARRLDVGVTSRVLVHPGD